MANIQAAQEAAEKIIQNNKITFPPIILEELAECEGLNVVTAEFPNNNDVSGIIDFENKMIVVNKYDSPSRQRFTIAHELGHWILHRKEIENDRDIVVLYRKRNENEENDLEVEADSFAETLLVPSSLILKLASKNFTNKELAEMFLVSEAVMASRRQAILGSVHE